MKKLTIITLLIILFFDTSLLAQDTTKAKWHYLAEIYLMFPNMKGEIGIAGLPPASVDADQSSIFGHLKFGAMLYFEASNDDWSISSDFLYMDLEQDLEDTNFITNGKVSAKQLAWEIAGLKRVISWFDVGIGARLIGLDSGIEFTGTQGIDRSGSESIYWVDPIIVMRFNDLLESKWILNFRGDIGGFGIGSKFAWQMQANAGYRFSKLFQATIGYRYISVDYDKDNFLYDIDTYGAVVRLGFNF